MRFDDQLHLGIANLWRTKLRTFLTTLGVCIGIGALIAMVSFGTGMQRNITQTFKNNDLFTSMQVMPKKVDLQQAVSGNVEGMLESLQQDAPPLNDSILHIIEQYPEVSIAFPEIRFPVKIRMSGKEATTSLRAIPVGMGNFKPYSDIENGAYFEDNNAPQVIINPRVLKSLKIKLEDEDLTPEEKAEGWVICTADSLLNKDIDIISTVADMGALIRNPLLRLQTRSGLPTTEEVTPLTLTAILPDDGPFGGEGPLDAGVLIPIRTVERIPRLGFSSVWSLLDRSAQGGGYSSLYVRVSKMKDIRPVRERIEAMGLGVFSIVDQLEELKRGFILMDTALGAVGAVALIVAALGIINTMVMSILERRREIGVMKAIGGSEQDIKKIFIFEAGAIGLVGGIFGVILGWAVTRIANVVVNWYIAKEGIPNVDFFFIPGWLIAGALTFAMVVSLLAGIYPAIRAARVDPVKALRHD